MNKVHELKKWPEFFEAAKAGLKPFEIRRHDRNFEVGDVLILKEWFPPPNFTSHYSGRILPRTITYIFSGGQFGLDPDYVILGVK